MVLKDKFQGSNFMFAFFFSPLIANSFFNLVEFVGKWSKWHLSDISVKKRFTTGSLRICFCLWHVSWIFPDDLIYGSKNQNSKKSLDQNLTRKKSNAEFPRRKNFQEALNDTTITNLHFEYPQKTLLKSHTPKNPCYNFSTPNNPDIKNFKPQTIRRSSLLLEIRSNIPPPPPPPPRPGLID